MRVRNRAVDGQGVNLILTNWLVRMNRYTRLMENVLVETRVLKFERFYAFREFTISNENNSTLGSAVSGGFCTTSIATGRFGFLQKSQRL